MALPPLANDCVVEDAEQRRIRIQVNAVEWMLFWDEARCKPDQLLANQDGFIRDGRRFVKAFRELVGKHCGVQALSQSLCYFSQYQSARATTAGRARARFPDRKRICKLASMLREAAQQIQYFEINYSPSDPVRDKKRFLRESAAAHAAVESSFIFHALSPPGKKIYRRVSRDEASWHSRDSKFYDMSFDMKDYASLLEMWVPPRADSIRSYGLIAPSVYCEIATGKPQYELVADLLSACSAKNFDPNLLDKRTLYFRTNFSEPYRVLQSQLTIIHENNGLPWYAPTVDYQNLLIQLEKSSA